MPEDVREERWKDLGIRVWSIIGVLVLIAVAARAFVAILPAVIPFLIGAVIVFLLRGPVNWLACRGAPRWVSALIWYLVGIVVLTLAGLFIFPVIANQLTQFASAFPTYYERASRTGLDLVGRYWNAAPVWAKEAATNLQTAAVAEVEVYARSFATGIVAAGGSLVTLVVDGVLALFIAFYILVDLPVIRREIVLLAGPTRRGDAEMVVGEVTKVVGGFLRGQAIIAVANGVLTAIGLWIVGIPYSGVIGLITGVLSIVPYIGPVVGAIIVGITGLFVSPVRALIGIVVMIGIQQVEGSVLSPRIMSSEVDLHPALVIFSLLVGAELAGLLGMLVAIPVAATGKALFVHYFEQRTDADLATEDGALFRQPKAETPPKKERRTDRTDDRSDK